MPGLFALLAVLLTAPPQPIHFHAEDGRKLHGALYAAERKDAPAVVLVHGLYGEPAQWRAFVPHLRAAGFTVLAYASRSDHEPDEGVLVRDVAGAVRALRRRTGGPIALVGSSVGGAAVAFALSARPDLPVRGGVALSAIEGPRERSEFRPHDLLLITDPREAATARRLRRDAHGRGVTIAVAPTTGHGVALLADGRVRARVIGWLERLTADAGGGT